MKRIKSFASDMPYEKFIKMGPEALSEKELLAIILRTGTRNHSATELADMILSCKNCRDEGLNSLHHLTIKDLMSIPGIGEVKAIKIKCISELAKRMAMKKAEKTLRFDKPSTVAEYFMEDLRHEEKENILLLSLDNKMQLIEKYVLSVGTVNASLLSSREVFVQALKNRASNVMLLHNHPSGDPVPSKQDILITNKIKEAGLLLDIPLMDHIIIGSGCYVSLKEYGLL